MRASGSTLRLLFLIACAIQVHAPLRASTSISHATIETDLQSSPYQSSDITVAIAVRDATKKISKIEVWLNDDTIAALDSPARQPIEIQVSGRLHFGSNELTITVSFSDTERITKRFYAYREPSKTKWILSIGVSSVAGIQGFEPSFATLDARTISGLLQDRFHRVFTLLDDMATRENILRALQEIRESAQDTDQLLVFISGTGTYDEFGEPYILSADANPAAGKLGLSLTRLINDLLASRISATTVLLDVGFSNVESSKGFTSTLSPQQVRPSKMNLAVETWLRGMTYHPGFQVMFAARPGQTALELPTERHGAFTYALVRAVDEAEKVAMGPGSCLTLADLRDRIESIMALAKIDQTPVLYSTANSFNAFCFDQPHRQTNDLISIDEQAVDDTGRLSLKMTLKGSPAADRVLVSANSIPVAESALQDGLNKCQFEVPLGFGENLLSVAVGNRKSTAEEEMFVVASRFNPPQALRTSDSQTNPTLRVHYPRVREGQSILNKNLRVSFSVGVGTTGRVLYEVRNNGVVVRRDSVLKKNVSDKAQVNVHVPLLEGINNITLEATNPLGETDETRLHIFHRDAQTIKAILVGFDDYGQAELNGKLRYSLNDVHAVKNALLTFTEAEPSDIRILTDRGATVSEFTKLLDDGIANEVRREHTSGRWAVGPSDVSLVLFFAGIGTTIRDADDREKRCLLFYVANSPPLRNCLWTKEIEDLLNRGGWKDTIIIMDASYDGSAGVADTKGEHWSSRTLSDYFVSDKTWRDTSGVQRDRVFLVCGGTNDACVESSAYEHGIFTSSLVEAIEMATSTERVDGRVLSLSQAFETAKDLTVRRTAGRQVPIFKGSLSTPFVFQAVKSKDLVGRVSPILERLRSDRVSMTREDAGETYRVSRILEKARAMFPNDPMVLSASANVSLRAAHHDDALTLVQQSIDLLEVKAQSGPPGEPTKENSEWKIQLHDAYVLQAQAFCESGRFQDAQAALKKAKAVMPESPRALAIEGEVNLALGDGNQAAKSFEALMQKEAILWDKTRDLPDEELGRAVIWHALALYESGNKTRSSQLLREYAAREAGARAFINILSIFTVGIVPWESALGPDATWSKRVAKFLIGNRSEGDLFAFLRENQDLDERSFNCQAHFYAGYFAMMNKRMELAVSHFHDAVATEQRQYPEYWVAKKKLAELAMSSWR